MIWIPQGFAHGYLVLSEHAIVFYKTTDYYAPQHERTLLWSDPELGIRWPLNDNPILSDRDRTAPPLRAIEVLD
jgi:dTDP-4-dehydrorhamnose 3,5-epimerase